MPDTGKASPTETIGSRNGSTDGSDGRRRPGPSGYGAPFFQAFPGVVALFLILAGQAGALDLFTLWQRPELPLNLEAGLWADYRREAHVDGRRTDDLLRIQCLGQDSHGHWVIEVVPLVEVSTDAFEVVPGEGLRLHLSSAVNARRDGIMQVVQEVFLWRDGAVRRLDRRQWREDPLVTASFSGDFQPDTVREFAPSVHDIAGRELSCKVLVFAAADTQSADLPQGRMLQAVRQEVSAAIHEEIPLLGLAHVAERIHSESWLDPPGQRRLPPPRIRIETLECLAFGLDAAPILLPGINLDD
jgi:hypothetical protein